jgi:(+)-trans-carveol dehydrogenase
VATPMVQNEADYQLFAPDEESPSVERYAEAAQALNALPIPWVEAIDISNALLFLASDEARYITGAMLPVDGGALVK